MSLSVEGRKPGRIARLLLRLAEHRRVALVAAVIGFVLGLPSLTVGYVLDDRFHVYWLGGGEIPGGPHGIWDLYRFADGEAGSRSAIQRGLFPWWTNVELKLAFFRPLASLWRAADQYVWRGAAWPPHLETCLLYAALIVIVAAFYRRLIGGAAAGLALIAFAVEDAHSLPVTWIANRYGLLAAVFAFASLGLHLRDRAAGRWSVWPVVLFTLALLSGETTLGVLGYFAAYAWFADPKGRKAGVVSLVPYAIVTLAWAIAYRSMGYGARGSAFYVDPASSPIAFARSLVERLPVLALAQVFGPPSEILANAPADRKRVVGLIAALIAGLFLMMILRACRRHPATRVLAWGSLIAVLPVLAVLPDDRGLLVPGVGFFGLLAIALDRVWRSTEARWPTRVFFGVMTGVHFFIAPLLLPLRAPTSMRSIGGMITRGSASIPRDAGLEGKTMLVLGTPDALMTSGMYVDRLMSDLPKPRRGTVLTVESEGEFTVTRTAQRVVEVVNPIGENGGSLTTVFRDRPLVVGEKLQNEFFEVEVLEMTATGLPKRVRFTLDEDPESQRWLVWKQKAFVEVPIPAVGETLTFPSTALFDAF